jgi:hypothetical protein
MIFILFCGSQLFNIMFLLKIFFDGHLLIPHPLIFSCLL